SFIEFWFDHKPVVDIDVTDTLWCDRPGFAVFEITEARIFKFDDHFTLAIDQPPSVSELNGGHVVVEILDSFVSTWDDLFAFVVHNTPLDVSLYDMHAFAETSEFVIFQFDCYETKCIDQAIFVIVVVNTKYFVIGIFQEVDAVILERDQQFVGSIHHTPFVFVSNNSDFVQKIAGKSELRLNRRSSGGFDITPFTAFTYYFSIFLEFFIVKGIIDHFTLGEHVVEVS